MRLSTLRSTTRDDDVDRDPDDPFTTTPTPLSAPVITVTTTTTTPTRVTRSRQTRASNTAVTTPSMTPKPSKDDTAGRVAPAVVRRGRRKRGRSPPPTTGDETFDEHHTSTGPDGDKNQAQWSSIPIFDPAAALPGPPEEEDGRRSRSLSVIPPLATQAVTCPTPEDPAVRTLGLSQSSRTGARTLSFEPEQLIRMREGHFFRPRPERKTDTKRNWRLLSLSEAIWNGLEEAGHVAKGRAWTAREGYDEEGKFVKPELPYVMLTKLVIASSPRKMLTLNQIYQAMEERWPYFRTLGQTFRNSIRHNLSMNPAFVNVERPACETRLGTGKGGHWCVSDDASSSHRGRAKKKPRLEPSTPPKAAANKVSRVASASTTSQQYGSAAREVIANGMQPPVTVAPAPLPIHYAHPAPGHGFMFPPHFEPPHYPGPQHTDSQGPTGFPNEYAAEHRVGFPPPQISPHGLPPRRPSALPLGPPPQQPDQNLQQSGFDRNASPESQTNAGSRYMPEPRIDSHASVYSDYASHERPSQPQKQRQQQPEPRSLEQQRHNYPQVPAQVHPMSLERGQGPESPPLPNRIPLRAFEVTKSKPICKDSNRSPVVPAIRPRMDKHQLPEATWGPQLITPPYDDDNMGGILEAVGADTGRHRYAHRLSPSSPLASCDSTLPPLQHKYGGNHQSLPSVAAILSTPLSPASATSVSTSAATPSSNAAVLTPPRCL